MFVHTILYYTVVYWCTWLIFVSWKWCFLYKDRLTNCIKFYYFYIELLKHNLLWPIRERNNKPTIIWQKKNINRRLTSRLPLSGIHHCKYKHIAKWSYHTKWWMHVTSSSYIYRMWMGAGNRLYADGRMRLLRSTKWKRQFECTIQRLYRWLHKVFDIINSRIVLFFILL